MANGIIKYLSDFDYGLKNFLLRLVQKLAFRIPANRKQPEKIIVFRTGSIGDSVCALPALSVIRNNFPDAEIDILTNSGSSNFVSLDKLIDKYKFNQIINYYGTNSKELFKKLKDKNYDLFIDLTQYDSTFFKQMKILFFARLLGIRQAFGWKVSISLLFKKYQEKHRDFPNEQDRLLAILRDNGLDTAGSKYIYDNDPEFASRVQKVIWEKNLANKTQNIGLVIGSKLQRNKWPLSYVKQIIDYFTELEYRILIFGGKEDQEKAESISISPVVYNFCGVFSPLETAQAMKFCSLVLTNDTGPMHLSYMVNTPVVAVFSSREYPGKWYPPQDGINTVFRSENVECSICTGKECPDNICMKRIKPEAVITAMEKILN